LPPGSGTHGEVLVLWDEIRARHPGDARGQISAFFTTIAEFCADPNSRGCAAANAAVELTDPASGAARDRGAQGDGPHASRRGLLEMGVSDPDTLADSLFLLMEGAQASTQSLGHADRRADGGRGERVDRRPFACERKAKLTGLLLRPASTERNAFVAQRTVNPVRNAHDGSICLTWSKVMRTLLLVILMLAGCRRRTRSRKSKRRITPRVPEAGLLER